MRWRTVCRIAGQLPEVLDARSYGTPVLAVRGSFFARLSDDRDFVLVKADPEEQAALSGANSRTFAPGGPVWCGSTVAVRLSTVERDELWPVLVSAWRRSAPPSLVADVDRAGTGP